jgi:aminoglycoside phosphotransferase (APT) family kinase protein
MPDEHDSIARKLEAAFARRGMAGTIIEDVQLLSGGASAETWSFVAVHAGTRQSLIFRRAHVDKTVGIDKATEARVQQLAHAAGVPTPEVRFVLDAQDGLSSGYVMTRVGGETIARRILREAGYHPVHEAMAAQCGAILQRIHAIDVHSLLDALSAENPSQQLDSLRQRFDGFHQELPVFEVAFRWLAERLTPAAPPALVHGDFRNGNFIVGPDGIRAVIDWELAHIGDPMEDLGWLCVNSWRFGHIDRPVGGFGDHETLFAAYEAAGGRAVDPDVVRYWEVYGTLRWGVICLIQAHTHLSGDYRSVERAAIGRRVSETEIDLLELIDPVR